MNDVIGVIVPIYKTEKYITECIESILAQTYTKFRLLLINDGSPDNSGKICDEYAKKDSRITVIHQKNAGVTRARARGVEEAYNCEFITFVDSDDTITEDALEHLISHTDNNIDIVQATMARYNGIANEPDKKYSKKRISAEQYIKKTIQGIDSGPTSKLFRRKLLTSDVFDIPRTIVMGEDTIANTRIAFKNTKSVIVTTYQLYLYRQHDESIMHTFDEGVEYEEKFLEYLIRSIPMEKADWYGKYIVINKIRTFDYHFGWSTDIPKWRGNHFYNNLIKEIKEYRIKELFLERKLITTIGYNKRKLLIFLKRVKNKIFGYDTLI